MIKDSGVLVPNKDFWIINPFSKSLSSVHAGVVAVLCGEEQLQVNESFVEALRKRSVDICRLWGSSIPNHGHEGPAVSTVVVARYTPTSIGACPGKVHTNYLSHEESVQIERQWPYYYTPSVCRVNAIGAQFGWFPILLLFWCIPTRGSAAPFKFSKW